MQRQMDINNSLITAFKKKKKKEKGAIKRKAKIN